MAAVNGMASPHMTRDPAEIFAKESQIDFRFRSSSGSLKVISVTFTISEEISNLCLLLLSDYLRVYQAVLYPEGSVCYDLSGLATCMPFGHAIPLPLDIAIPCSAQLVWPPQNTQLVSHSCGHPS
jgi:hypothetical protein